MAAAAGMDPVEFRLKNLTDPSMIRVLKAAAETLRLDPGQGAQQTRLRRGLRHRRRKLRRHHRRG